MLLWERRDQRDRQREDQLRPDSPTSLNVIGESRESAELDGRSSRAAMAAEGRGGGVRVVTEKQQQEQPSASE